MTDARGRHSPQMAAYEALGQEWRAYLMFIQTPGFVSKTVNTDRFGLRYTGVGDGRYSVFDAAGASRPRAALVGGSTAFGVGASSDAETLSAHLGRRDEHDWFNLGARAYSGTQELVLYANLLPQLRGLRRIVMFSGLNDLLLPAYVTPFDEVLGAFYFSGQFRTAMRELEPISRKRELLRWLLRPFAAEGFDFRRAPMKEMLGLVGSKALAATSARASDDVVPKALAQVEKNLLAWVALVRAQDIDLLYVLQPNALWCKPQLTAEEAELFAWLDAASPAPTTAIIRSLDATLYARYRAGLADLCGRLSVRFADSNDHLRRPENQSCWLFVDRAHLTDAGNAAVADFVHGLP